MLLSKPVKNAISLSYSTALVLDAGTDNVYLICVFIRFISCLLRKVKYCDDNLCLKGLLLQFITTCFMENQSAHRRSTLKGYLYILLRYHFSETVFVYSMSKG